MLRLIYSPLGDESGSITASSLASPVPIGIVQNSPMMLHNHSTTLRSGGSILVARQAGATSQDPDRCMATTLRDKPGHVAYRAERVRLSSAASPCWKPHDPDGLETP